MAAEPGSQRSSVAARGTIQLLAARGFFMLSGYVITVILARRLGPAGYGIYGVTMSFLLWLEVLSGFGIPRAAARLIAESRSAEQAAEAAISICLAIGVVLLAVCWIAAPYVAGFFNIEGGALYLRLAVLDLPFNGLYIAYQGTLVGQRKFGVIGATLVIYSLTKVAGILALFLAGFSIEAALIVNVLATAGALVYLLVKQRIRIVFPDRDLFRTMAGIAAPLAVFVVTMQFVISAHLWTLKRMSAASAETIGYYVAALNIAQLPSIVPAALASVVLSSVAVALAANDFALAQRYVRSAGRFVVIVLAPVCVLGGLHATSLMSLVYSGAYEQGGVFLGILLGGYGLFALFDTLLHALIGADKHYLSTGILLALVPVALIVAITMIFAWGAIGSAFAFVATLAVGLLVAVVAIYKRFLVFPVSFSTLARVVVATAASAALGSYFDVAGIWVLAKLAALMLVYLGALGALGELQRRDLELFAVWKRR